MTTTTPSTSPVKNPSSSSTGIDRNTLDDHRTRSNFKFAQPAKRQHPTTKPYKGITSSSDRTLVHLIGNNVPSLSLESIRKNSLQRVTPTPSNSSSKWILAPFENPARKDGLKLKHWVRSDHHQAYRFAKYNTTSNVYSYTTQEYYHLLRDDDWTKEETDYLFDLLNTYDLRFPVVHDRYEFLASRDRSLDDLKSRYYSICQKLIQHRPTPNSSHGDDSNKKQLIQSYNFDKQRETERKRHVKSLLNRTSAQLMEEEFVYIETRRIEQNLLKRVRNRDELMKLIGGAPYHMLNELRFWPAIDPSATNQQLSRLSISHHNQNSTGLSSQPQSALDNRSIHLKKWNPRKSETLDELPTGVSLTGGEETEASSETSKPIDQEAQTQYDKKNCIYRSSSGSLSGSSHSSAHHHRSVGLRSTRITLPKTAAASARLSAVMNELKIPSILNYLPKPLIMPTRENVESYERLIQATHQLIDLKRIADRVESDLKAHRKKKETLMNAHSSSHAPKTSTPGSGEGMINPPAASVDHRSPSSPERPPPAEQLSTENDLDQSRSGVDPAVDPFSSTTSKKRSVSVSSGSCSTADSPQHQRTSGNPSRKKVRKN